MNLIEQIVTDEDIKRCADIHINALEASGFPVAELKDNLENMLDGNGIKVEYLIRMALQTDNS